MCLLFDWLLRRLLEVFGLVLFLGQSNSHPFDFASVVRIVEMTDEKHIIIAENTRAVFEVN